METKKVKEKSLVRFYIDFLGAEMTDMNRNCEGLRMPVEGNLLPMYKFNLGEVWEFEKVTRTQGTGDKVKVTKALKVVEHDDCTFMFEAFGEKVEFTDEDEY